MVKSNGEGDCIDPKHVPCEKARNYLEKHGKLCGVPKKKERAVGEKKSRLMSFVDYWLG